MHPSNRAGPQGAASFSPQPVRTSKGKSMTSLILGHRLKVTKDQLGLKNDSMFFNPGGPGGSSTSAYETDEQISVNSMTIGAAHKGRLDYQSAPKSKANLTVKYLRPQMGPWRQPRDLSSYPKRLGQTEDDGVHLIEQPTVNSEISGISDSMQLTIPLVQIQGRSLGTSYNSVSLAGLGLEEIPSTVNLFRNATVA